MPAGLNDRSLTPELLKEKTGATFRVAAEIPLPDYRALECSECQRWFVWPKKNYRKSPDKPSFCPHCGASFEKFNASKSD
jgi:ribosomal protein L33